MVTSGLNYTTNYYYQINNDRVTAVNWACFSELYRKVGRDNDSRLVSSGKIGVKVYFDKRMNLEMHDNYCLLNKSELKQYFEWIRKTTSFNIRFSSNIKIKDRFDNYDHKIISINFKSKYPYEIKLICALVRNLYECPYNIMVKSAFLMESLDEFSHLDFTERLCIAIDSINGYNTGHSVFGRYGTDLYNNKSIRKRYLNARKSENNVNGFMLKTIGPNFNSYYYSDQINEDTEETIFDSLEADYISDKFKAILIKNYKILKNE